MPKTTPFPENGPGSSIPRSDLAHLPSGLQCGPGGPLLNRAPPCYLSSCILSVNHFLLLEGKYALVLLHLWISSFCYSTWLLMNTVIIWLIDWLLHFLVPVDWGHLLKNWLASFSPVLCLFYNSWGSQVIISFSHFLPISVELAVFHSSPCTPPVLPKASPPLNSQLWAVL